MIPPLLPIGDNSDIKTGHWWTKVHAPLREWQISVSYDFASDCEETRGKLIKKGSAEMKVAKESSYSRAFAIASTQADRIATDDPRLKEK